MFRTTFIFILLFCDILFEQHASQAAQSLDNFFPFGLELGDERMVGNDDGSIGPIALPHLFPYFDNNHRQIYQANNGLFSFLSGIRDYIPIEFPLGDDQRLVTPFWSDIDTRGYTGNESDNSVYHHVYSQTSSNVTNVTTAVFTKATLFVRQFFPRETTFEPLMVITGTWYRVGYCCTYVDLLNTFQIVLATDESRSFAFFLYNDLQWGRQKASVPYAQAGFNAGDGETYKTLKYSRTSNITLLVNESNVNTPGIFAFRIDTADIDAGGCSDSESLTHLPVRGGQIGGTTVKFQGPCFNLSITEILCRFGEFGTVHGSIENEFQATCVSPLAAFPGSIDLSVSFDRGNTFVSSGLFRYMQMDNDVSINNEIILRRNGTAEDSFSWNDTIQLEWTFSETSLAELPPDTLIDIEYDIIVPDEEGMLRTGRASNEDVDIKIDSVIQLATNIRPQVGCQTIEIDLSTIEQQQHRIIPIAAVIGVVRVVWFVWRGYKIYKRVKRVLTRAMKRLDKPAGLACNILTLAEPNPSTWNQNLPPCPNILSQARVARAQYEPDPLCKDGWSVPSWVPIIGNCKYRKGRPKSKPKEEDAVACYYSKTSNAQGASAQCCYNKAEQLITRGTGAGRDSRYKHQSFWRNQFGDVLPFLLCCKVNTMPLICDSYLQARPSRPGSDTMGQFGGTWGDPHFLTLDGTSYTFNGYGEYTYLAIPSQQSTVFDTTNSFQFESQIRTTSLGTSLKHVTSIRAFAARTSSLKISITISRRDKLVVHLNDDELAFDEDSDASTNLDIIKLRFEDFSIAKNRTNNQFTLSWDIGVSMQITPTFVNTASTLVLNVAVAVSGELKGNWTLGLVGNYDGDPANDLRDKFGTVIGTVDMLSLQQIHELYGMTWAIDPARSLFYYESNDNALFYSLQNQNFRPSFQEPSADLLELSARETCGIAADATDPSQWSPVQQTCYYDVAVTGDLAFGRVSRQAAEEQVEQRQAMRNPPKFNSALSLTQFMRAGQQVNISFQATSEFSSTITYELLHGPAGASLDRMTGQFTWQVPDDTENNSRIPVQVSAQDATYNLKSTYEVVLEVQQKNSAHVLMTSALLFVLAFALASV